MTRTRLQSNTFNALALLHFNTHMTLTLLQPNLSNIWEKFMKFEKSHERIP